MKKNTKKIINCLISLTVCFSTITTVQARSPYSSNYRDRSPELEVISSYTINVGENFDPMKLITRASDAEDGPGQLALKNKVVVSGTVNKNVPGKYVLTFVLTDRQRHRVTRTSEVTVRPNQRNTPPVLEVLPEYTLNEGDSFGLTKQMTLVKSAVDKEDGNLMSKVKVKSSTVNPKVAGVYSITFEVTDKAGATATKTCTVTVKGRQKPNTPPVLDVLAEYKLKEGQSFGGAKQMTLVKSATDAEDGSLMDKVKVTNSTVNPKVAGIYSITFEVTDSAGAKATKTCKVIVEGYQKPTNTPPVLEVLSVYRLKEGQSFGADKQKNLITKATDAEDTPNSPLGLVDKVKIISEVMPKVPGTYWVTFELTDSAGATVSKRCEVIVEGYKPIPPMSE